MRNSFKARAKKSQLEKEMSTQIIYIFIVQMLICFFGAVYYTIWYINCKENVPYLGIDWSGTTDHSFTYNLFVRLGNWILMFGNFVPISLLVTLEMVKFIQAIIIAKDHEYMTSYANGLVTPCVVQSSNLNEELG
jgi:phospholipid-transporting ATPase